MPDITDQILAEITPDPLYNPLCPTVGKLEDYAHNFRSELAEQIGEALGFASEKKRITLPAHLRDRLEKAADHDGVSVEEKITQLLDSEEPEPEPEPESELPTEDQLWHREMKELVQEHDRQLWLWGAITRLFQPVRMFQPVRTSQYSWLRQLRLQT